MPIILCRHQLLIVLLQSSLCQRIWFGWCWPVPQAICRSAFTSSHWCSANFFLSYSCAILWPLRDNREETKNNALKILRQPQTLKHSQDVLVVRWRFAATSTDGDAGDSYDYNHFHDTVDELPVCGGTEPLAVSRQVTLIFRAENSMCVFLVLSDDSVSSCQPDRLTINRRSDTHCR